MNVKPASWHPYVNFHLSAFENEQNMRYSSETNLQKLQEQLLYAERVTL